MKKIDGVPVTGIPDDSRTAESLEWLLIINLFSHFSGDTCLNPQVKSEVYTSTESHMSYQTAVVIEFELNCKNGLKVIRHIEKFLYFI